MPRAGRAKRYVVFSDSASGMRRRNVPRFMPRATSLCDNTPTRPYAKGHIMRPKIMVVFGTRPEIIKMYPVIKALENSDDFHLCCLNTAQHRTTLSSTANVTHPLRNG